MFVRLRADMYVGSEWMEKGDVVQLSPEWARELLQSGLAVPAIQTTTHVPRFDMRLPVHKR